MNRFHSHTRYMQGCGRLRPGFKTTPRGAGLGSVLSRAFTRVLPVIKKALSYGQKLAQSPQGQALLGHAKKEAINAGLNIVTDGLKGKQIMASTKEHIKKAREGMAKKLTDNMYKDLAVKHIDRETEHKAANAVAEAAKGGAAASEAAAVKTALRKELLALLDELGLGKKKGGGQKRKLPDEEGEDSSKKARGDIFD